MNTTTRRIRPVFRCESEEQRIELRNIVRKRYYEKNKEKIKERNRRYYLKKKKAREINAKNTKQ